MTPWSICKLTTRKSFFPRVANLLNLGLGETYMEGIWSCPQGDAYLVQFISRFLKSGLIPYVYNPWNRLLIYLEIAFFNLQGQSKSLEVCDAHYNLGNDLYEATLDPWMQYTNGYWTKATNLNDAQLDKLDLIARKLDLKPGMRVLDLGCGWGMLAKYLAERHGIQCVGVNISKEQIAYARKKCKGLPVEIWEQDYRDVNDKQKFDRVVSIGMMEHVGFRNYDQVFAVVRRNLKDDGIFLLQTNGLDLDVPRTDMFFEKYLFPNGHLPFPSDITKAAFRKFIIQDWHNFGPDYAKTMAAWRGNFNANWHKIKDKYDEKFYRMWVYYLALSEALYLARFGQLWQIVMSTEYLTLGYRTAR